MNLTEDESAKVGSALSGLHSYSGHNYRCLEQDFMNGCICGYSEVLTRVIDALAILIAAKNRTQPVVEGPIEAVDAQKAGIREALYVLRTEDAAPTHRYAPLSLLERAAKVLERTANDTLVGRNTAAEIREFLAHPSAEPMVEEAQPEIKVGDWVMPGPDNDVPESDKWPMKVTKSIPGAGGGIWTTNGGSWSYHYGRRWVRLATNAEIEASKPVRFGTWVECEGQQWRVSTDRPDPEDKWTLMRTYTDGYTERLWAQRSEFTIIDPQP